MLCVSDHLWEFEQLHHHPYMHGYPNADACSQLRNWNKNHEIRHSLACQVSTANGLEVDDDVGDLQIALLLQVSQNTSSEEDLTLTDAEQVGVQLQGSDLQKAHEDFLRIDLCGQGYIF